MTPDATVPAVELAITVEDAGWGDENRLEAEAGRVLGTAVRYLAEAIAQPFPEGGLEISLLFTGDDAMRRVNAQWRAKDQPTNVLSFPSRQIAPGNMPDSMLGDIVLARETIVREAERNNIPIDNHVAHLLVHGLLHLIGYDHMTDAEARQMENLETRILSELGLSDPYANTDPA